MIKNLSKLLLLVAVLFGGSNTINAQEIKFNDGPQFIRKSAFNLLTYPRQALSESGGLYIITSVSNTELFREFDLSYYDKSNKLIWNTEFRNIKRAFSVPKGILVIHGPSNESGENRDYMVTFIDEISGKKTKPRLFYHKKDIEDQLEFQYNAVTNQVVAIIKSGEKKEKNYELGIELINADGSKASSEIISFENTAREYEINNTLLDTLNNQLIIQSSCYGKEYATCPEIVFQKLTVINLADYSKVAEEVFSLPANVLGCSAIRLHNNELHLFVEYMKRYNSGPCGIVHAVFDYPKLTKQREKLIVMDKFETVQYKEDKPSIRVLGSNNFNFIHFDNNDELLLILTNWYNTQKTIELNDILMVKLGGNDAIKWVTPIFMAKECRPLFSVEVRDDVYLIFFHDDNRNNESRLKYGANARSKMKGQENFLNAINMAIVDADGKIRGYKYIAEENKEVKDLRGLWSLDDKWYLVEEHPNGVYQTKSFKLD
jgi:hypothetical protein